jgi:hypothetical protein
VIRTSEPDTRVWDVRTYKLVSGGRDDFDRLFRESVLSMLDRFGIHVVAYGSSIDDHYYLIRSFASAARRDEQLDSFYGSDEWRENYREAVLARIETYHVVVIELTPTTRQALISAISADMTR